MNRLGFKLSALIVSTFGLVASSPAMADWAFTSQAVTAQTSFNTTGTNTGGSSVAVNVTGWTAGAPPATFAAAPMTVYSGSGIGIQPGGDAEHGMDNLGNTDAVVFSFASSQILNSVRLGYVESGKDSDISVLRWMGDASGPLLGQTPNMANMTWATLISSGWELVGSYADLGTTARTLGNTTKGSSWWLVSAYNSTYGGATPTDGIGTLGGGNDYFKLAAVAGAACTGGTGVTCGGGGGGKSAPEPTSLALLAVALAGALASTRRRSQGAAV